MMRGEKNGKSANQIKTCPPTVNPYKARAIIPAIINRRLQPNGIQGLRITPANLAACFSISCLSSSVKVSSFKDSVISSKVFSATSWVSRFIFTLPCTSPQGYYQSEAHATASPSHRAPAGFGCRCRATTTLCASPSKTGHQVSTGSNQFRRISPGGNGLFRIEPVPIIAVALPAWCAGGFTAVQPAPSVGHCRGLA